MPLNPAQRDALRRAVGDCRARLEGEVADQLERIYGFSREGAARDLQDLDLTSTERGIAEELREWHRHLTCMVAGSVQQAQVGALRRMAEETAFTLLHRLAALRMAEERGVLRPCLRDGLQSEGFRLFFQIAGGALGPDEEAYTVFLQRVFDEIGQDLPALFDRREPRSLVFPRPASGCLDTVVRALNQPELQQAWQDDEVIGWVYQDFHSADERREMRRGVDVPRNATELAIRNQLFTPRWVVEFLGDNTLGRLWVEMTAGRTSLGETCSYLLRTPVQTPLPPKDPREIRVLDPACGSGHFLLYAFDLLEQIYAEAWDMHVGTSPGRTPVWIEYPDHEDFLRRVPALILRHNLFGVDIDPRPIQVAALALWFRAQRSWRALRFADRPRIHRMNLVCAEAVPGDATRLDAFAADLRPEALGGLVRRIWQEMRTVGEQGLLLRIDQRIRDMVREARDGWSGNAETSQGEFFDETPNWTGRRHDLRDLATDEMARFWSEAEELTVQALGNYAARAGEHERILRRLFAEDAERGFAFIDLSRARYDVILMNPPFGQPAEGTKDELDQAYPDCGHEIYAMFFQRAMELVEPHGRVGAITNRTWLTQTWLRGLREAIFGELGAVTLAADLGYGALEAKVETCAVVVETRANADTPALWVRLLRTGRKNHVLTEALQKASDGCEHFCVYVSKSRRFRGLPEGVYPYWMSDGLVERCDVTSPTVRNSAADVKQGTATASDFRFVRLSWEITPETLGLESKWPRFAKGGEYRPFWDDIHLVVNWETDGAEIRAWGRGRPQNTGYFGREGVTWPVRTTSAFGPRALSAGCAFSNMGSSAFPMTCCNPAVLLGVLASRPTRLLLHTRLSAADDRADAMAKHYEVGMIRDLPWPTLEADASVTLAALVDRAISLVRTGQLEEDSTGETCMAFRLPPTLATGRGIPLRDATRRRVEVREAAFAKLADIRAEIDDLVAAAYGFTDRDLQLMDEELEPCVARYPEPDTEPDPDLFRQAYLAKEALDGARLPGGLEAEVDVRVEHRRAKQHASLRDEEDLCRIFEISPRRLAAIRRRLDLVRSEEVRRCAADVVNWAVGVAFGRWDVRLLDHPEWEPGWADPFGPLPRCPLGQLVDSHGLPATSDHLTSEAWLAARTDAGSLPRVEADAEGMSWVLDSDGRRLGPAEIGSNGYPLSVSWDGVIQDDVLDDEAASRHGDDLYRRVSLVLEHVYGEAHGAREAELAAALGRPDSAAPLGGADLRDWLRRPGGFFADHLSRYSKSRRRAPIYWPLSTSSGGFTLWLYYPRLSAEMLAACIHRLRANEESLQREEERLLNARRADTLSAREQARLDRLPEERRERAELREDLRRWVDRDWHPHLDDGAVMNAAPLARWFRHRPWRDVAEATWNEVLAGEHDWSHLAMTLRPQEVLARCKTERDLAIAHGRENLYVPPQRASRRGRRSAAGAEQLVLPGYAEAADV